MSGLNGKVALVTGGARGIGAAIAHCLAAQGAAVAIMDLDGESAQATAASLPHGGIGLAADAADEAQMADCVAQTVARFGGLDVMVNNAGIGANDMEMLAFGMPFTNITQRGWDHQVQANLRTTFCGCKVAIPALKARGGGAIVNVASIAGLTAMPAVPAYAAAKAGVISLTRSLALELAPELIRVNAICPGYLWTKSWEMLASIVKGAVPDYANLTPREVFLDVVKKNTPMGREQMPEDIGHLTAFLAGPGAVNITGQEISVDGGILLNAMR